MTWRDTGGRGGAEGNVGVRRRAQTQRCWDKCTAADGEGLLSSGCVFTREGALFRIPQCARPLVLNYPKHIRLRSQG